MGADRNVLLSGAAESQGDHQDQKHRLQRADHDQGVAKALVVLASRYPRRGSVRYLKTRVLNNGPEKAERFQRKRGLCAIIFQGPLTRTARHPARRLVPLDESPRICA